MNANFCLTVLDDMYDISRIDANIHAWSVNPPIEEDPETFQESAKFQTEADVIIEYDGTGILQFYRIIGMTISFATILILRCFGAPEEISAVSLTSENVQQGIYRGTLAC